jgi:hypothetical protein
LAASEHVPDRFGEAAGEVDLGDLGAAPFTDPCPRLLVAVAVGVVGAGVVGAGVSGGLDQRPAEMTRPLLGEWAAQVAFARLVGAWEEAAVAGELAWGGQRVMSPISAAIDRSEMGQGLPWVSRAACTRCFRAER